MRELREKLIDIALHHPKIGIGQVLVPRTFSLLQHELLKIKEKSYLRWLDYVALAESIDIHIQQKLTKVYHFDNQIGIEEEAIQDVTTMLHDTGFVVWHNVPKLKDMVVIDPQWLANAMAGVVTFLTQNSIAKDGGMTNWYRMQKSLRLK